MRARLLFNWYDTRVMDMTESPTLCSEQPDLLLKNPDVNWASMGGHRRRAGESLSVQRAWRA